MAEHIDNRQERIRRLKTLIKDLHTGRAPDEVRSDLKELVRRTDATEIVEAEQALIAHEGISPKQVAGLCDMHSAIVREILVAPPKFDVPAGHPIDTFTRENEALRKAMRAFDEAFGAMLCQPLDELVTRDDLLVLRELVNAIFDVEKHYQRKEILLFSMLERHGINGPSKVMWAKDDEVREMLKALGAALREDGTSVEEWRIVADVVARPALAAIEEMISKEENILLPMAMRTLTEEEWAEVWRGSPEIGYCLAEPGDDYRPGPASPEVAEAAPAGKLVFPTGALDAEQAKAILRALPLELTFVDASDRVRFFTSPNERTFPRPKAILGRDVHQCHPPASVDVVDRILGDFRAGREDSCTFWIQRGGKFVLIRFFAVRDEQGHYLGTLETTQELSAERGLEGERRLLEYDPSKEEKTSAA